MKKGGFTLVELLVVVGVIAILTTIGIPNYLSLRDKKRLDVAVQLLAGELNSTMERSRSQESGAGWWVHLDNPTGNDNDVYYVCYGTYTASAGSCALEGGTESKRASLGPGLQFTDPGPGLTKDVVFAKATGLPTSSTTVTINSTAGAGSKTTTINSNGSISF